MAVHTRPEDESLHVILFVLSVSCFMNGCVTAIRMFAHALTKLSYSVYALLTHPPGGCMCVLCSCDL